MSIARRVAALDEAECSAIGMAICREDRDRAIVDARYHGATLREISERVRITPQGIAKILARVLDN